MRPLERIVNALCEARIGRRPNLSDPRGYNDLIQWLKLHDQRRAHIIACDKLAVRDWVANRAGEECLIPLAGPDDYPCIMKCTHDSGSAVKVRDEAASDRAMNQLSARLRQPYGVHKAEWAYQFVPPAIIAERMLPGEIVDFKFHCGMGKVRWVQVIGERSSGKPRETIISPDGKPTGLWMDHKMGNAPDANVYPGDEAWHALTELALILAADWRYVRVDLYWSLGQAWFGELTFFPLAGCYLTADEPRFGEMLELDLTEKMDPIVL